MLKQVRFHKNYQKNCSSIRKISVCQVDASGFLVSSKIYSKNQQQNPVGAAFNKYNLKTGMRQVLKSGVLSSSPTGNPAAGRTFASQTHFQLGTKSIPELNTNSFYQPVAIK